jgi:hypothetical protein
MYALHTSVQEDFERCRISVPSLRSSYFCNHSIGHDAKMTFTELGRYLLKFSDTLTYQFHTQFRKRWKHYGPLIRLNTETCKNGIEEHASLNDYPHQLLCLHFLSFCKMVFPDRQATHMAKTADLPAALGSLRNSM